jgi:histidinol-phosphate aminotransferase
MLDVCDHIPAYIKAIEPYQPGKPLSELERELGIRNAIKLASNENPLGPSPLALAKAKEILPEIALYPDGHAYALRQALARFYGISSSMVVPGNGSNDILDLLARLFLKADTEAIYSRYAFAIFRLVIQMTGALPVEVQDRHFSHSLQSMQQAINGRTRMIFIANPNNPTGTFLPLDELYDFLEQVPSDVVVVLDEAYIEYLPDMRFKSIEWLQKFSNLVITRTFSKVYGLAGLRVGYALMSETLATYVDRIRPTFNVNSLAQAAAVAALDDETHVTKSVALNESEKKRLTKALANLGFAVLPSFANFLAIQVGNGQQVFQALLHHGVIVRPLDAYGMPAYIRVTIGLPEENERFLSALQAIV